MKLSSKLLAVFVIIFIFGGVFFTTAMGWWATESSKVPAKYSEGEAAGEYDPADIRGSYSFGDINASFDVPIEVLSTAFQIPAGSDAASFQLKSLEEIYAGLPEEIGTSSVRLFVALYKGLPVELDGSFLLPEAVEILKQQGTLSAEQEAYLAEHTVGTGAVEAVEQAPAAVEQPAATATAPAEQPAAAPTEHVQPVGTVTGKTTFQNLLDWGVAQDRIEGVIGEAMPAPQTVIKDYCALKGLEFSTIKTALQAEIAP